MGRKDDIAVGDFLTRKNGKQYRVVEWTGCGTCAFDHKGGAWCEGMRCIPSNRSDHKEVIFRRII